MVATLCLIGCVLVPAQPPDRPAPAGHSGDYISGPRPGKSQEFVYRGTYDEESTGDRVHFCRSYRFDTRIFVLDTPPNGTDVAILTVLKQRDSRSSAAPPGVSNDPVLSSARLELARVELNGRVQPEAGVNFLPPLDGPPTVECGAFVELPSTRAFADGAWSVAEVGRPPRNWQKAGSELVNGNSCVKVVGDQQSAEWAKPRGDRGAWRRTDTVWIATRLGLAYRVERLIELRDAAHREVTHRSVLRYELDSSLQYPGQLSDERRQEIMRARSFCESAAPLLGDPTRYGPQLSAVLTRINLHLDHQPPTPYRDAILQLRRQVEAARRGETAPAAADAAAERPAVATVGQLAPDFVASELTAGGAASVRLRDWVGKPLVMVFYNPASPTAEDLFRFVRGIQSRFNGTVAVVGLSVSDDASTIRRQQAEYGLAFPVLNGGGLRVSYGIESTPKIVLIDAGGVVRGSYLGWGRETPAAVLAALREMLQTP